MWDCTECDFQNDLDPYTEEEQLVICAECGAEYEVLSLDPLELSEAREGVPVDVDVDGDGEDDDEGDDDNWE